MLLDLSCYANDINYIVLNFLTGFSRAISQICKISSHLTCIHDITSLLGFADISLQDDNSFAVSSVCVILYWVSFMSFFITLPVGPCSSLHLRYFICSLHYLYVTYLMFHTSLALIPLFSLRLNPLLLLMSCFIPLCIPVFSHGSLLSPFVRFHMFIVLLIPCISIASSALRIKNTKRRYKRGKLRHVNSGAAVA